MTKKHNSSKKSKQKTQNNQNVSITDPAVFVAQDVPASTTTTTTTTTIITSELHRSTSFASSHASLASLADLDHEPTTPEVKPSSVSAQKKSKKHSPAVSANTSRQQKQQQKETEGDDLWSWLTATHTAVPPRSDSYLDPKQQPLQDLDGTQKQTTSSWYETRRLESLSLRGRDWVILSALTAATIYVRLWRMDASPAEVVLDEAHVGKYVNGYLKKEFTYDIHPPLGKLLFAGISKQAGQYDGSFGFDEVGDAYGDKVPYMVMRTAMAIMGALCAPMAYVTLRNKGQSAPTAILATLLIALDNALVANNRFISLEAPLMFFTALSFMSWTMFAKQSQRPFGFQWWLWLLMTGLAASGAMATKLSGALTVLTMGLIATWDLWGLITTESVSTSQWVKHGMSRLTALAVLPVVIYTSIYYLHFQLQIYQPRYVTSVHGDYDLTLLSPLYRHSLHSQYKEDQLDPVWSDIVYGSVVQLQSETQPPMYVHSVYKHWPKGSKQLQVAAYEYPDLSNHWIVIRANLTENSDEVNDAGETKKDVGEIPVRLQHVHHGDWIRLRHVAHRHCMHSHDVRTMGRNSNTRHCEVSAYGSTWGDFDGDQGDWWRVEAVNIDEMVTVSKKVKGLRIKALETAIRLRHYTQGCYLHLTGDVLDPTVPGGEGRVELSCLKDAAVLPSSIWRFSMNDHDYLPAETELAAYPKLSFWKKFKETHKLIRTKPRAFDMNAPKDDRTESSDPLSWLLLPTGSPTLLAWRSKVTEFETGENGHVRQISLVPNPVSWVIRTAGLVLFFGFQLISALRYQRGYFDGQDLMDFKSYQLSNAGLFFTGWALHYLPLFALKNSPSVRLNYRDYFPALYFGVLMSCTILSGVMKLSAMPRLTRAGMWLALSAIAISAFIQLSPLTYGTLMSPQQCTSLASKINPAKIPDPGYAGVAKGVKVPLIQPTLKLNCATWKQHSAEAPFSTSSQSDLETFAQFKSQTELHVSKPMPRKRAPVLEPSFPSADEALPMAKVFMTPCQRPPQLWGVNRQEGRPNAFQRQQMQYVFRKIEREFEQEEAEHLRVAKEKEEELKNEREEARTLRMENERIKKAEMEKENLEKARLEEERQEKERVRMEKLEKERSEVEQMAMSAAMEDERQWREEARIFNAELARAEAEKQYKLQLIVDKFAAMEEAEQAEKKAKAQEEEAKRQQLHRQKVAAEAAARAADIAAASKAAENVFMHEAHAQAEKEMQESGQAKTEEVEQAGKNSMPSRQDFRESIFKRAAKVREVKLEEGHKFTNDNHGLPPELSIMFSAMSAMAKMNPIGAQAARAGPLGGMDGLGDLGNLEALQKLAAAAGNEKPPEALVQKKAAKPVKPVKPAEPAFNFEMPPTAVGAMEKMIEMLAQAEKMAIEKKKQWATGTAPPPPPLDAGNMPPELMKHLAGLEKLAKNGNDRDGLSDDVVAQLGGVAKLVTEHQMDLRIEPEVLVGLRGAFEEMLVFLKEGEEVEKHRNKQRRKW
ncbi:hypothetical protein EC991_010643 [Linnemannia zychae]|nr:hypothetical protein EC991_010643 [Linnemannia zychae]